jgi:hypothetical protein
VGRRSAADRAEPHHSDHRPPSRQGPQAASPPPRPYQAAGYRPNRQHAHRLVTKGDVAARVRDLQRIAAKQTAVTVETFTVMFLADREFARQEKNPGAAIQATERLA